ncbi:MAG: hypothetical protein WBH47_10005 [Streptosporangiaceae bacterium]
MKRIILAVASAALVLGIAACGSSGRSSGTSQPPGNPENPVAVAYGTGYSQGQDYRSQYGENECEIGFETIDSGGFAANVVIDYRLGWQAGCHGEAYQIPG